MILLTREIKAITAVLGRQDPETLRQFLADGQLPPLHEFSASRDPSPAIALKFVALLKREKFHIVPALEALITRFSYVGERPIFDAALVRMQTPAVAHNRQFPWEEALIAGVPMVNRAKLRAHLQNLVNGVATSPIMMINGPSGTGRTHSWYLIKHVADDAGVRAARVDLLSLVVEQRTLEHVFQLFARKVGMAGIPTPIAVGLTAETAAALFAEHFCDALEERRANAADNVPTWIVIDNLDRTLAPEIKRFICTLAAKRLRQEVIDCTFFLLGADHAIGLEDPARRASLELLGPFNPDEITAVAELVNSRGGDPLDAATLGQRIQAMQEVLARATDPGEACATIADLLVLLRMEVDAS